MIIQSYLYPYIILNLHLRVQLGCWRVVWKVIWRWTIFRRWHKDVSSSLKETENFQNEMFCETCFNLVWIPLDKKSWWCVCCYCLASYHIQIHVTRMLSSGVPSSRNHFISFFFSYVHYIETPFIHIYWFNSYHTFNGKPNHLLERVCSQTQLCQLRCI